MFALTGIGSALWRVATIMIPIPLALIVIAGLWWKIDTSSRIRNAVDKAVTELVAGAQIKALEATLDAERRLRMFAEGREAAAKAATEEFEEKLAQSELENQGLIDELTAIQAQPPPPDCIVSPELLDRLRKR